MNQLNSYYEYVKSQLDLRIVHDKETERERERNAWVSSIVVVFEC